MSELGVTTGSRGIAVNRKTHIFCVFELFTMVIYFYNENKIDCKTRITRVSGIFRENPPSHGSFGVSTLIERNNVQAPRHNPFYGR